LALVAMVELADQTECKVLILYSHQSHQLEAVTDRVMAVGAVLAVLVAVLEQNKPKVAVRHHLLDKAMLAVQR
jgi:hypothetical protein